MTEKTQEAPTVEAVMQLVGWYANRCSTGAKFSDRLELISRLREAVEALAKDARRYRWLREFLDIDDVGDEHAVYGLVLRDEDFVETAWRARCWSAAEYHDEEPSVDDAIDAALAKDQP